MSNPETTPTQFQPPSRRDPSGEFTNLGDRTPRDYVKQIAKIEVAFSDFPLSALSDRCSRGEFLAWRDRLAERSKRQGDYAFTVLARVLSWVKNRGLIESNPCEKGGRLYHGNCAEFVWGDADELAFLAKAPMHLHAALVLGLWTGQREQDLLDLPWAAYGGKKIRLKQRKTRIRVVIPVGAPLKRMLDAMPRRGRLIILL